MSNSNKVYSFKQHSYILQNVYLDQIVQERIKQSKPDELILKNFKPILTVTADGDVDGSYWEWSKKRWEVKAF